MKLFKALLVCLVTVCFSSHGQEQKPLIVGLVDGCVNAPEFGGV